MQVVIRVNLRLRSSEEGPLKGPYLFTSLWTHHLGKGIVNCSGGELFQEPWWTGSSPRLERNTCRISITFTCFLLALRIAYKCREIGSREQEINLSLLYSLPHQCILQIAGEFSSYPLTQLRRKVFLAQYEAGEVERLGSSQML